MPADPDAELTFIVGARHGGRRCRRGASRRELLELARLAVAARAGADRDAGATRRSRGARERGASGACRVPRDAAASTSPRRWCASGSPRASRSTSCVGAAVAGYIAEHGLYRRRREAAARER